MLRTLAEATQKTEVLYDAYRSVCFSKSKTMGPRILGLLTASIVLEKRTATDEEEPVFKAAEALSDPELLEFFKAYRKYSADSKDKKPAKMSRIATVDRLLFLGAKNTAIAPGPRGKSTSPHLICMKPWAHGRHISNLSG